MTAGAARRGSGPSANLGTKPLLSIDEAAILLGESRLTIYRAVKAGTLPLPTYLIGHRLRIPRRAVERLLAGLPPATDDTQAQAGDDDAAASPASRRPTCSAARRSAAKPSV